MRIQIDLRYLLFFCFAIMGGQKLYGQGLPAIRDTLYYVWLTGPPKDNRVFMYNVVLFKDLSFFKNQPPLNDMENFTCSFFQHSVLYIQPPLRVDQKNKFYGFLNDAQFKKLYQSSDSAARKMAFAHIETETYEFSNGETLGLFIVKIAGEFWLKKIKTNRRNISLTANSFKIGKDCYSYDYVYLTKKLDAVIPLKPYEMKVFYDIFRPYNR